MTANDWVKILGTVALGGCAVLLAWKGDVAHAMTFGALLVPSAAQLPGFGSSSTATVKVQP